MDAVFDPAKNKLFAAGGRAQRWLLTNERDIVIGRIAAFVNPSRPPRWMLRCPPAGWAFECLDDQTSANLLFDVACEWLRGQGMLAVDGPINFGDRDRFWGVLIDGFDREPNYGMFWHPAYYQKLLRATVFSSTSSSTLAGGRCCCRCTWAFTRS
ncbi:MAG: hypothetical protein WKG07_44295 [Hymenobacter sp.]